MIHTVIFDVGGTLVAADDIFELLARELGNAHHSTALKKRFSSLVQERRFRLVKDILQIATDEVSQESGLQKIDASKLYAKNFTTGARLYEDTLPVLRELKENRIRMLVCSDADADILRVQLNQLGILDYFDKIIISSEVGAYKPSNKMVAVVAASCGPPLNGILFVGDADVDVKTAEKLGVIPVLIDRTSTQRVTSGMRISSLRELLAIVSDGARRSRTVHNE